MDLSVQKRQNIILLFCHDLCCLIVCMQFLTELDGVETLTGVFVFAATRLVLKAKEIVVSFLFCLFLDFNFSQIHPFVLNFFLWTLLNLHDFSRHRTIELLPMRIVLLIFSLHFGW